MSATPETLDTETPPPNPRSLSLRVSSIQYRRIRRHRHLARHQFQNVKAHYRTLDQQTRVKDVFCAVPTYITPGEWLAWQADLVYFGLQEIHKPLTA